MINVKVLSIKSLFQNITLYFLAVLFIVSLLIIYNKQIRNYEKVYASEMVNKNVKLASKLDKRSVKLNIIQNELNLKLISKSYDKVYISDEEIKINGYDNVNKLFEGERFIDKSSVRVWDRPKEFIVATINSSKTQVGNMYITNYIGNKLDNEKIKKVSKFEFKDNMDVLIYHTHTSEGYFEMKGESNFRSTDDNFNVVAVGSILKDNLEARNFNVNHSKLKHDTPSYNGAYASSLNEVQRLFGEKKYDLVFDIHRDALSGNINFRPTVQINGETAAKLMFVVGTNVSGLKHDDWINNLKLAILIQNTANEMYPGLFRDLTLSKSRYNQHVCEGAFIIEVGATGNTLDEAKTSMKYFVKVLEALKTK